MFEFVSGPLVWAGFLIFFGGSAIRLGGMARFAAREQTVFPTMDFKFGLRSIAHWIVPFAGRNMRLRPFFTLLSFAFHLCLIITPLFALGHAVLWRKAWGIGWWSLPGNLADAMTLAVIGAGLAFALRRVAAPEVRNVTNWRDWGVLTLVLAPFITGFVAHHQWLPYRAVLMLHIVSGVLWLAAIPFTRLAHMLWFVFTRAYMGSEFGKVRKSRDW